HRSHSAHREFEANEQTCSFRVPNVALRRGRQGAVRAPHGKTIARLPSIVTFSVVALQAILARTHVFEHEMMQVAEQVPSKPRHPGNPNWVWSGQSHRRPFPIGAPAADPSAAPRPRLEQHGYTLAKILRSRRAARLVESLGYKAIAFESAQHFLEPSVLAETA